MKKFNCLSHTFFTIIFVLISSVVISQTNSAKQATTLVTELKSGTIYHGEDFRDMIAKADLNAIIPGEDQMGYHCFAKITSEKSVILFSYQFDNDKKMLYLHAFPFKLDTWEPLEPIEDIYSDGEAYDVLYNSTFNLKDDHIFTIYEWSYVGEGAITFQLGEYGISVVKE